MNIICLLLSGNDKLHQEPHLFMWHYYVRLFHYNDVLGEVVIF